LAPDKKKKVHLTNLADLPNGVFVKMADWGENAYLVCNDKLLLWTPGGYSGKKKRPHDAKALVLTPKSIVEVIRAGYIPEIHPSAAGTR
jgi:hypothetical protein